MQSENGSIMAVFEAVATSGALTRAEISAVTGFSRMTVGKAVDILDRMGVIIQTKRHSESVGRKSDICSLEASLGMIVFDLSEMPCAYISDISLSVLEKISGDDLGELAMRAFMRLGELVGGELMGVACVIPGEKEDCAAKISQGLGMDADIIISAGRAYAIAAARRFGVSECAIFLRRFASGRIDGAVVLEGKPYTGAHGKAGDFSSFEGERLGERIAAISAILDPALIHISCENEGESATAESDICDAFANIPENARARIIVEPSDLCPEAAIGAMYALREHYIRSKIPKTT